MVSALLTILLWVSFHPILAVNFIEIVVYTDQNHVATECFLQCDWELNLLKFGGSMFKVLWSNVFTLEAQSSKIGGSKAGYWMSNHTTTVKEKSLFNRQITTAHVSRNTLY
jgi:hypothetical protein